jgi:hypothetical protein
MNALTSGTVTDRGGLTIAITFPRLVTSTVLYSACTSRSTMVHLALNSLPAIFMVKSPDLMVI